MQFSDSASVNTGMNLVVVSGHAAELRIWTVLRHIARACWVTGRAGQASAGTCYTDVCNTLCLRGYQLNAESLLRDTWGLVEFYGATCWGCASLPCSCSVLLRALVSTMMSIIGTSAVPSAGRDSGPKWQTSWKKL